MSGVQTIRSPEQPKALGAYYTDARVANFLVGWAVRSAADHVLDPSFGGGVFLREAAERIRALSGDPGRQVWGVEIDRAVHRRTADALSEEFGVREQNLLLADFFALGPGAPGPMDAVVGNPPFIRYQRFSGPARARALNACAVAGVRVSRLASSWVPFLVRAVALLRPAGRLAMVVPAEIAHAAYARPLLEYLARSFRTVTFVSFQKRLFPGLSEDTLLLLADTKGAYRARFLRAELPSSGSLRQALGSGFAITGSQAMSAGAIASGQERMVEHMIPPAGRDLYREVQGLNGVCRLGQLADVGIGYVTGANDYFHVSEDTAASYEIPRRFLRRAVRRGSALVGLRFTARDWALGDREYLVHLPASSEVGPGVRRFIEAGRGAGVHQAYKCRIRSPWYRVPHVREPDALLTYMSGVSPRLVANDAAAVAPNTLHTIELRSAIPLTGDALAALWQTSLTLLSAEIEGHPLGGGMLKLEPTEAENVLLPAPQGGDRLQGVSEQLDALIRSGRQAEARDLADRELLQHRLGLTPADCQLLKASAEQLRARRYRQGATA